MSDARMLGDGPLGLFKRFDKAARDGGPGLAPTMIDGVLDVAMSLAARDDPLRRHAIRRAHARSPSK